MLSRFLVDCLVYSVCRVIVFFFFKQKTAYELRISDWSSDVCSSDLYNIGNNRPEELMHMIDVLEEAVGKKAVRDFQPLQAGDVPETYANIDAISSDLGFAPTTSIEAGIPRFVDWFKAYHQLEMA